MCVCISRPDRLRDIADRFNLDQDAVLDNVLYARAYTSNSLLSLCLASTMEATFVSLSSACAPCLIHTHTHTHTRLTARCPGLPGWAGTRKVKPIWILLKQETVSGSGISWAVCKSASRSRQITTPAPHRSVFYRPDALPVTQPTVSKHWRQKGNKVIKSNLSLYRWCSQLAHYVLNGLYFKQGMQNVAIPPYILLITIPVNDTVVETEPLINVEN